jgi:phosphoribosylaminoimidazolecarboxamide formyltransferase/IMP cyclohydrolase
MSPENTQDLRPIRRALLSVSDKTGLIEFARALINLDVQLLSTGGTARALRDEGIEVLDVSEVTGFPEMLDGRVKTLHPRIHGGLLAVRDREEHMRALSEHGIAPIDMVVVNLYPFEQTISREGVTLAEAVEQIDIGGPSMVRSAAKNCRDVAVVVSPADYAAIIEELRANQGALSGATRGRLAQEAFSLTARYDYVICHYLLSLPTSAPDVAAPSEFETGELSSSFTVEEYEDFDRCDAGAIAAGESALPDVGSLFLRKNLALRYGENPHQVAALYHLEEEEGVARAELLGGKEMSFNNYVDADAAWQLACDFAETACAIVKHMNPSGVGLGATPLEAYRRALATDPLSAFGGVVAFNRKVDEQAARAVTEIFTEVLIAPDYEEGAIEILRTKKNLRILRAGPARQVAGLDFKRISGGMLVQTRDTHRLRAADLEVVTKRAPNESEIASLLFAWTVCKHTKSNAIVYARDGQTVGVGAGQMSRVDSVRIGAMRAQLPVEGSVVASDAFFPFRDGVDEAARHGITAIIQPGGSVRDEEVIAAADEHGLAMVFSGVRHFRH